MHSRQRINESYCSFSYEFSYRGFHENPEGKYEFRLRGPQLVLAGPYSIKGRILILPITGNGYSNFTLCKLSHIDCHQAQLKQSTKLNV